MTQTLEVQTFGNFDQQASSTSEYLTIVFSPSSVPLRERWRTNRLSASFIADYFSTFFPGSATSAQMANPKSELMHITTFVANELLENAMKFSDAAAEEPVTLTLQMYPDRLVFLTRNRVDAPTTERFLAFVQTFVGSDLNQLYLHQLEKNAAVENSHQSGMGILTLANDYFAEIGWKFEFESGAGAIVTTRVQLAI